MPELLILATFIVVATLTFLLAQSLRRLGQDPLRERIESLAQSEELSPGDRDPGPLVKSLAGQMPRTALDNGELHLALRRAGLFSATARTRYLAVRNGSIIAAILMTATAAVVIGPQRETLVLQVMGVGLAVTVLCWAVPRLLLQFAGARRVERIRQSLPYALDMITMCITGGSSFRDAIVHVGRDIAGSHPDLAVELLIVRQQAELSSLEFALRQFAGRIAVPEVEAIYSLVTHLEKLGVNAGAALQEYADGMRQKWRQQAEERANAATVKLLFPLALCLMPSVLILLWGPAAVDLWKFLKEGGMATLR
jgi:tight adherence protein C